MQPLDDLHVRAAKAFAHRWPAALASLPFEDACQEAWIVLQRFKHLPDDRAITRAAYELLKVAERYRQQAGELPDLPEPPQCKPSYTYVHDAVSSLPAVERYIVQRHFWCERSLPLIAQELGVSERTVHRRYKRALETLRERIGATPQGVAPIVHGTQLIRRVPGPPRHIACW